MSRPIAPDSEFVESDRMRNRNFRMSRATEEAYLQAARDLSPDDNVSDIFRRVSDGRLPNLVDLGYLCSVCLEANCTRHATEAAALRIERDKKQYEKLHKQFGDSRATE